MIAFESGEVQLQEFRPAVRLERIRGASLFPYFAFAHSKIVNEWESNGIKSLFPLEFYAHQLINNVEKNGFVVVVDIFVFLVKACFPGY